MIKSTDNIQDKDTQSLGKILLFKREELNLSVGFIAEQLNVKERDIRAIEKDDLESVSSHLYLSGIISEYTKIVGLDKSIINKKYCDLNLSSKRTKKSKERFRVDDDQNHSPEREVFMSSLVASVIIILIILFYYNYTIKTSHNKVHDFIKGQEIK